MIKQKLAIQLLLAIPAAVLNARGAQPSSITISSSTNPSIFGQAVTLTATVSPSPTGIVTFYDGTTVLGTKTLASGKATLTTSLLPSGARFLKAYYGGNDTYAASTSAALAETVSTLPASGFQPGEDYRVGAYPRSITIGDFNGDGKADMAVANSNASDIIGSVSVLLGNGDGTFQPAVNYGTGRGPISVVVGDFNGDGRADLAVANGYSDYVSILLGNGDGTFQSAVNYPAGNAESSVVVGDFNGDGMADLVVGAGFSLNVLLGNGDGTFQPAVGYAVGSPPSSLPFLAIGDFNGDGRADLAVANFANNNLSVLLGNGDGTFQPAVSYYAISSPTSVAVGDFNGDGKADLAVANANPITIIGSVSVLLGNGDGTFQPAVIYGTVGSNSVAVGDFNGDGRADLAVANDYSVNSIGSVSVLLGNGDGTFQPAVSYGTTGAPPSIAVADFNGDGKADLAVDQESDFDVRVLLATTSTGSGCIYAVAPILLQPPAPGGNVTVGVQTGASCSWAVQSLPDWITISDNAISTGPGNVTLAVAANPGGARTATISVAGTSVVVTQLGTSPCTFSTDLGGQTFTAAGGSGTINVIAPSGCQWSSTSTLTWVTITKGSTGSGNGMVTYQVAANSGAGRSGTLTIAGLTFTVEEASTSIQGLSSAGSMAQLASGGGQWTTTITLLNTGTVPAEARLNFFDDNGNPLSLPLTFPQSPSSAGPLLASTLDRTVNSGAALLIETAGLNNALAVGWAQLLANGTISGFAVFTASVTANQQQEAVVTLENRNAGAYVLWFDDTNNFATGVALANVSTQTVDVNVVMRDDTGTTFSTQTIILPAHGHTSFDLASRFGVTANRRGTLEFDTPPSGQISVLGLRFNPALAFSSIPSLAK